MQKTFLIITSLIIISITGCEKEETAEIKPDIPGVSAVKVVEHMNASNYTYMLVSEKGNEYWIAVPQMDVNEDEILYYSKSMEIKEFRSETLDRTFESILFVEDISRVPQNPNTISSHPDVLSASKENISIEPLKDGKTVEAIYNEKESLKGKKIKVRGKVVKYNEGILNRNWIHIQDGTGDKGKFDLVVTSNDKAALGDLIVVEGVVELNRDFGSGYTYAVLVEDAKIKVE